jgi:hypothetical protein
MTITFDINFDDISVAPILSCESLTIYVFNGGLRIRISTDGESVTSWEFES